MRLACCYINWPPEIFAGRSHPDGKPILPIPSSVEDIADAACGDSADVGLKTVAALLERIENLGRRRADQQELERARAIESRRMQGGTARRWLALGAVALLAAVLTGISLYRGKAAAVTPISNSRRSLRCRTRTRTHRSTF